MSQIHPAEAHALKTRRFAQELAACSGWQEWALPYLRTTMQGMARAILSASTLQGDDLVKTRAAFQALEKFLVHLQETAKLSFDQRTPSATGAGLPAFVPDPIQLAQVLESFNWQVKPAVETLAPPPAPVDDAPLFSPFTAPVAPAARAPTPTVTTP